MDIRAYACVRNLLILRIQTISKGVLLILLVTSSVLIIRPEQELNNQVTYTSQIDITTKTQIKQFLESTFSKESTFPILQRNSFRAFTSKRLFWDHRFPKNSFYYFEKVLIVLSKGIHDNLPKLGTEKCFAPKAFSLKIFFPDFQFATLTILEECFREYFQNNSLGSTYSKNRLLYFFRKR